MSATSPPRRQCSTAAGPTGGAFAQFLSAAYPVLYATLGRLGVPPSGPPGALYPPFVDDVVEIVAYVPVAGIARLPTDTGPVTPGEVPAATVAVLTHHGGYDSIADTYQLLGRWVAERAVSAEASVREIYVTGPTESADPAQYRTDIWWPLAAETPRGLS